MKFIKVRYNGFAHPRPSSVLFHPSSAGCIRGDFTCGGGGVESTCYIFPLFSGVVVDVLRSIYMRARFVRAYNRGVITVTKNSPSLQGSAIR